jgi:hypothetical protein
MGVCRTVTEPQRSCNRNDVEVCKKMSPTARASPSPFRFAAGVSPTRLLPTFSNNKQISSYLTCSATNPDLKPLEFEPYAMSNLPRSQPSQSRLSTVPSQKPRQLSHLQAQLAQLTANMADLESLMRMTAGQAQDMRGLGGYAGAM